MALLSILVVSALLVYLLSKNYLTGICYSLFFLVVLPHQLGILLPGNLPVLTAHRVIIILLIFFWLRQAVIERSHIPYKWQIIFIILANSISLVQSVYFEEGFKKYLQFVIENCLFFVVMITSLRKNVEIEKALRYVYKGIVAIAVLGIIERYTEIHILNILPSFIEVEIEKGVFSTFSHPILLGAILGQGVIISIALINRAERKEKKFKLWLQLFLIGSCLYFTASRGPWLAAMIGLAIMLIIGRGKIIKLVGIVCMIPLIIFIIKPEVYNSVIDMYYMTFPIDGKVQAEAASYIYRWELWIKAYKEISKSTERLLFGYGFLYHRLADLSGDFTLIEGRKGLFQSWDNEYACLLLEVGFVGIISYAMFYIKIAQRFMIKSVRAKGNEKYLMTTLFACVLMVLFMASNVKLFSPQLMFAFYFIIAIGTNYNINTASHDEGENKG